VCGREISVIIALIVLLLKEWSLRVIFSLKDLFGWMEA
jgi:hypothetical protein